MLLRTRNLTGFFLELMLTVSLLFPTLIDSAYVQPYSCDADLKPLDLKRSNIISNPIVAVMIKDNFIYYRLDFLTSAEINDVNYTTNLYTTLNIQSKFINGAVFEKSVRLCEYVRSTNDSSTLDPFGFPSVNATNQDSSHSNTSIVPWPTASNIPPLISKRGHKEDDDDEGEEKGEFENICPLSPHGSYQINYAADISSDRYFGSYQTKFTFLGANETENNEIGCFQVYATPYHPTSITYPISFGVMAIFIIGAITNFYIYHFSSHQESDNVFLIIASSICNEPLLNELTPDVTMLFNFLQFVLFACALDLNYPGFLQPIISYLNWVALIRIDIFSSQFINALSENGVYKSLGRRGLFGIFPEDGQVPRGDTISKLWKNFMVWIWCIITFFIIITQLFIFFKQYITKNRKISGLKSRFYFAFGSITQFFYVIFPLPFVSLSCFLILGLSKNYKYLGLTSCVFCIIFLFIWLLGFTIFSIKTVILQRNKLYSSFKTIACWSSLYHWYKPECSFFLIIKRIIVLFQGIVIGFGQDNGIVQLSLLIFIEIVQLLLLFYFQPYFNKIRNVWGISVSFSSLVILGLNIAYIRELYVPTRIRSVIGDVQLFICALIILIFFTFFIIRTVQVFRSTIKKKNIDNKLLNKVDDKMNDSTGNDTTLDDGYEEEESPEFESEAPFDYHRAMSFPRPRLEHHHSRQESIRSKDSSIVELTDQRVLPGLSLSYLHSKEYLPAPVSPIDDEFLANVSKNDSELRNLWAKRNNFKRLSRFETESSFESGIEMKRRSKASIDEVTRGNNKGFQVVGRKPIVVNNEASASSTLLKPQEDKKKGFQVVGRKPIVVNHNARKRSSEDE